MARLFVIFFCCGIYCVGWAMRICFLTNGNLSDQTADLQVCGADVILCGFQALGEVSYERELRGETNLFEDVALLSKEAQNVVIGGCFTDSHSMRRKSVVVAERGRILGVSDMVNRIDGGAYRAGAGVKIYETKVGRLGVIVAEDIYFPRVGETLSACGAEIAINIFEQFSDSLEPVLARAQAFFYGIPFLLCGYGYAFAADIGGKVRFASPRNLCSYELTREQEYHLVETRQRGFYRKKRNDF